ncbi:C45 family autoproteolytic acyltransferase/hydolase [Methylovirgula sp. 4M-Z18]|uniref:C45 family autoproteolytic acyltransferase/hydolase n=1 Tax=Methylovirgula sp. 4M-Z18 TaxID=2293567 RepID=UPI000E2F9C5D|nr:C45 family peptidase [Methylovirgula sp. 4M-Z18]RFB79550.1 hypothetical protein DYH55_08630 [Methylovirgula sp. 4M-Z18]
MRFTYRAFADDSESVTWGECFQEFWPAYRRWYVSRGISQLPTFLECRTALRKHLPEFVPTWEHLCRVVGGGDLESRFLSLYRPPPFIMGCSQAVWPGDEPLLVRNYDYDPRLIDGTLILTHWGERRVIGTSDCLIGLVDGMNDAGLAVSLTFGGRRATGNGFAMPIVLRYVLETCSTVGEAVKTMKRMPYHMSHNVTLLDASGGKATVYAAPDRRLRVSSVAVATNHQKSVEWKQHALATASVEREQYMLNDLLPRETTEAAFAKAFLQPPLYSRAFDRGFGTLFTAAYWPRKGEMAYLWPRATWKFSFKSFKEGEKTTTYNGRKAKS